MTHDEFVKHLRELHFIYCRNFESMYIAPRLPFVSWIGGKSHTRTTRSPHSAVGNGRTGTIQERQGKKRKCAPYCALARVFSLSRDGVS